MSDARRDGAASRPGGGGFSADIAAGILASLVWTAATALRLGRDGSIAVVSVAFACAVSSAVPLVTGLRALGERRTRVVPVAAAAMVVVMPLATFGGILKSHTHHRALGAVTFTFGAAITLAVAWAIVRRVAHGAKAGHRGFRIVFRVVLAAGAMSVIWAIAVLLGASAPESIRSIAVDGVIGALSIGVFAGSSRPVVPGPVSRYAIPVLVVVLGAAILGARKNAALFAVLCERAPLTLGIAGVFSCP
jgi:hypothetical protein